MFRSVRSRRILSIFLLALLAETSVAAEGKRPERTFKTLATLKAGNYTVEFARETTYSPDGICFRILDAKSGEVLLPFEDGASYCIDMRFHDKSFAVVLPTCELEERGADPLDFDRDGQDELVIVRNSGGQGCCNSFVIVKVTPKFKLLGDLQSEGHGEVADVDGDGEPEFMLEDMPFYSFEGNCAAGAANHDVPLHYKNGKFDVDLDALRTKAPEPSELDTWGKAAALAFEHPDGKYVPQEFWGPIVSLWYGGHPDIAKKFFDDNWPKDRPGKAAF